MSSVLNVADFGLIGLARQFAVTETADLLSGDRLDDVALVVSELVTNALEHGHGEVEIEIETVDGMVALTVGSDAGDLPLPDATLPPVAQLRGRGLHIVAALADAVMIRCSRGRVEVEVHFLPAV